MKKAKVIVSAAVVASVLAGTVGVAYSVQKNKAVWICGKKSEGAHYIFKTGNEYIITYPENAYGINSYLVSSVDQKVPKRWKPENSKRVETEGSGFKYKYSYSPETTYTIKFDTDKGLLTDKEDGSKSAPSSKKCIKLQWDTAIAENEGKLSGVPLKYLDQRSRLIDILNPKLGNKKFNIALADSLTDAKNGEYSVYKLLSSLDRNVLNSDQIDTIEQSKKKLLNSSSQEATIWESTGMFTFYSSNNSEDEARAQCNRISTPRTNYTSEGYEVISSNAADKTMGGGTVCQGTFLLLKKEGYID